MFGVMFHAPKADHRVELVLPNLLYRVTHKIRHRRLLFEREAPQVLVALVVQADQQPLRHCAPPDIVISRYHIARKFRRIVCPSGVRIDSGWNCTPSTASSRCRTPMITPLSLRALTSSTSGTLSGRMASEW